jgi:hypothetical protein
VKNGWHFEQTSVLMVSLVERVVKLAPHAQMTLVSTNDG